MRLGIHSDEIIQLRVIKDQLGIFSLNSFLAIIKLIDEERLGEC